MNYSVAEDFERAELLGKSLKDRFYSQKPYPDGPGKGRLRYYIVYMNIPQSQDEIRIGVSVQQV